MWPAFFMRVSPASRKAKPACMNMTSTAATTTQIVLAAIRSSWLLGNDIHLLEPLRGSVVGDVRDRRRPDDPVAGLVAASGGVDDRLYDLVRLQVVDDEDEQRLRQKAGLEHATAVLVRDPALAAVADRLDHGHADMAGRVLDGVDHGLDALADHD